MEKDLICQKENHNLPLDMVCIDKNCSYRGLLCHKCFMTSPHNHMGSDIVSLSKFVDSCSKALDTAFDSVANSGEQQISAINEEYYICKKLSDKAQNYAENLIKELFQKLRNTLEENYRETLSEYEGPRNNATKQIDNSRAILRELKNGLVADNQEVAFEISNLTKYIDRTPDGQFTLNTLLTARTDPKPKEKKLMIFKHEGKKFKQFLDRFSSWTEQIPVFDPDASKVLDLVEPHIARHANDQPELRELKKKNVYPKINSPKKKDEIVRKITELGGLEENIPMKKLKTLSVEKHDKSNSSTDTIDLSSRPKKLKSSDFIQNGKDEMPTKIVKESIPLPKVKTKYACRLFFDETPNGYDMFKFLDSHAISFKVDKEVMLKGFAQYLIAKPTVAQGYFDYAIYNSDAADEHGNGSPLKAVVSGTFRIEGKGKFNAKFEHIFFENPLKLDKGGVYTLKVTNKTKNLNFWCYRGNDGIPKRDPFVFFESKLNSDASEVTTLLRKGQLPELVYSEV